MESTIRYLLANFTLTLFVVGIVCSAVTLARAPKPLTSSVVVEALFSWFLLFSIGIAYTYNAVMKVFFGEMAAAHIGWANSPFQDEVGYASLGLGIIGFLAVRRGFDMRLAAVIVAACFLWGAALTHVREMAVHANFNPGNAGAIFWTDIFVPIIGIVLLYLQSNSTRQAERGVRNAPAKR